jgi:hypothetical protein
MMVSRDRGAGKTGYGLQIPAIGPAPFPLMASALQVEPAHFVAELR